jgi:outer membrane protein assembly factor BamD
VPSCRRRLAAPALLCLLLLGGCGAPRVRVHPDSPRYEFELGSAYLVKGDHLRAQEHLKRFLDLNPGHAVADSAQYQLGLAILGTKSFAEAAVEFAIFVREFPRSPLRDDAAYQECVCYLQQMRPPPLDQTSTHRARGCFNELLLRYPDTDHAADARTHLHKIADRLAEKELRVGMMYARQKKYRSAIIYLDEVGTRYPTSSWVPSSLLWKARCQLHLSENDAAITTVRRLLAEYPQHEAAAEARRILEQLGAQPAEFGAGDSPQNVARDRP